MKRNSVIFIFIICCFGITSIVAQPTWDQMIYSEKEYKGQPVEMDGMVMDGQYDDTLNMIFIATGSTNGKFYDSDPVCIWISDRDLGDPLQEGSIVRIYGTYKMMFPLDEPILGTKRVPVIDGSSIVEI